METIFLLNGLLTLFISIFLIYHFIKKFRDEESKKILFLMMLVGILYLVFATFSLLWFLNILEFSIVDFPLIYSLLIFLQTFIIFRIAYSIKKNKKIFLMFLFYLGTLSAIFLPVQFAYLISLTSFLLTLLLFLLLLSEHNFEKIANLGVLYASLSLIFQILILFKPQTSFFFAFFSNLAFLLFVLTFIKKFEQDPSTFFSIQKEEKENSFLIDFLKYFIFIITLTNFIFIGTISIHEVGHLSSGKIAGCEFGKIVYEDGGLPHTEILCGEEKFSTQKFVLLGGIVLPLIIALLLIFAGGVFIKESALLVIGFNLIISYKDLIDFGFSKSLPIFLSIIGGLLVILGVTLLAKSRTAEKEFVSLG